MVALLSDVVLGGLGWDPGIRGILIVFTAFVILMGSIYVIVATNTGARLGLLISFGGFFGWMVILTLYWTISPPGIGPAGPLPSWKPVEIHYNTADGSASTANEEADKLPSPDELEAQLAEILEENEKITETLPNDPSLSDVAGEDEDLVKDLDLGGWSVIPTSEAGEAQASVDEILVDEGVFSDGTEYKKLAVFEIGGKPKRNDVPDDEWYEETWTRVTHKVESIVNFKHPPRYAIVQVQAVIHQEPRPGEPPPLPEVDPDQPVISVVLVRDLGNQRGLPAQYLVISTAFFIIFVLLLHYRDRTFDQNLADARAAKQAAAKETKG